MCTGHLYNHKLDGIHNSSNTEVAPAPAPQVSQPEVPQQLDDLDGASPAEEQARAMFPRYTWDPLPYDHFKHFRGNIPITAGTLTYTLTKDTLSSKWSMVLDVLGLCYRCPLACRADVEGFV